MTTLGLRLAQGAAPDLVESTLWHHPEKRRSTHYCTAMYHINRVQSLAVVSGVPLCMGWIWGWETDRHSAKLQSEHRAARIETALWWHHLFCQDATSTAKTCASRASSGKRFCFSCVSTVSYLNRLFCDDPWSSRKSPRSCKEVFLDSQNTLPTLVRQNDTQTNNLLQPQTVSRSITYTHRHASP